MAQNRSFVPSPVGNRRKRDYPVILVDTSIWIDHLRKEERGLVDLLEDKQVAMHPFIVGEIALGYLKDRDFVLYVLTRLPRVTVASHDEVLDTVGRWKLFGAGIGYTDAHLLAAVALTPGTRLWTRDKNLQGLATRLGFLAGVD